MATMNSTQETILKNWVNNHLDLTLDILAREMLIRVENQEICAYDEGYQTIFEGSDEEDEEDE